MKLDTDDWTLEIAGMEIGAATDDQYYEREENVERYDDVRRASVGGRYIRSREEAWLRSFFDRHGHDLDDGLEDVTVLDVGGGTGWVSRYLDRHGAAVTYLDGSAEMRDAAEALHDRTGYGAETYEVGDATDMAYADDAFAYAVSIRVAHVIPEETFHDYVSELGRVAEHGAFMDAFRSPSLRDLYTGLLPMDSTLYTDREVMDAVEDADTVRDATHTRDFVLPYVCYKDREHDLAVDALATTDTVLRAVAPTFASVSVWDIDPA